MENDSAIVTAIKARRTTAAAEHAQAANKLSILEASISEVTAQAETHAKDIHAIEARLSALAAAALLGDAKAAKQLAQQEDALASAERYLRHCRLARVAFAEQVTATHAPVGSLAMALSSIDEEMNRQLKAEADAEEAQRKALLAA